MVLVEPVTIHKIDHLTLRLYSDDTVLLDDGTYLEDKIMSFEQSRKVAQWILDNVPEGEK